MIKSFKPVADENTKIMIIGSMPGEASLKAGQYYAYKYNQFWPLMTDLLSPSAPPASYKEKLQMLLNNNIGLWDSLAVCKRAGSLDGNIKEEKPNDFKTLLKKYPKITTLLFNGQAAHKYFVKYFGMIDAVEYKLLPSTSPAAATKTLKQKRELWAKAIKAVN